VETPVNTTDNVHLADVPTVAEYKTAFLACRPALRRKNGWSVPEELLKANYHAPDHTITATELAERVGLANFKAANLAYGAFAKALAAALNRRPKFNLAILVSFTEARPDGEHIRLTMLPQVVAAIEELGWVRKPSDD
jgi:hypothetical protein